MQTFYGVTPSESAATGLAAFNAGAGMRNVDTSLMAQFQFSKHWSTIAVTQYSHLLGPADDSPITVRLKAGNRVNLGTFLVYSF